LTLPTGVSTFLIECLDVDSTPDYNTGSSDSVNMCSSPEIFRNEYGSERSNLCVEDFAKYKNSTLLDSSKAVTIDKMPQISNLSAILATSVPSDFTENTALRQAGKLSYRLLSYLLIYWKFIAGKKVCKITAARERTPDLKNDLHCSSLVGLERKGKAFNTKKTKCTNQAEFSRPSEEGALSFRQLESAPENTSARSRELTAQVLPSKKPDATPLCNRGEICSIVRTSPRRRSSRLPQIPLNRSAFCFPKRMP
ncbi:MEIKN protein, partial [Crypturellus undulatus]|nr:MEIKN protein [Crypturellus undulatus]